MRHDPQLTSNGLPHPQSQEGRVPVSPGDNSTLPVDLLPTPESTVVSPVTRTISTVVTTLDSVWNLVRLDVTVVGGGEHDVTVGIPRIVVHIVGGGLVRFGTSRISSHHAY